MLAALVLVCLLGDSASAQARTPPFGGFVQNVGQWDAPVAYMARVGDHFVAVDGSGLWLHRRHGSAGAPRRSEVLRITFDGLGGDATVRGVARLPGVHHYFLGDEPARWRTHVERFAQVQLEGEGLTVSVVDRSGGEGIELLLQGRAGHPITISLEGIDDIEDGAAGGLSARSRWSSLLLERPQLPLARRRSAAGSEARWRKLGARRVALDLGGAPDGEAVHVGLVWSTLLGGTDLPTVVADVARDADNEVVVGGHTASPDFPATPGAFQEELEPFPLFDVQDAYVARFSPDGSELIAATFLGGKNNELTWTFTLAGDGSPMLAGQTYSTDFPTTAGGWDSAFRARDGFIAKLSPACDELVFATAVGGSEQEIVLDLLVLPDGRIVALGWTESPEFAEHMNGFDTSFDPVSGVEYFIIRLLEDGSAIDHGTFLGALGGADGSGYVRAWKSLADDEGRLIIVGRTSSPDFFATTTVGAAPSGNSDVFVTRFDPSWLVPETSLLFGGTGSAVVYDAARSSTGHIAVVGSTSTTDFPTTPGAFMPVKSGIDDAYVACVDPSLSELTMSTYLGGVSSDRPWAVTVDDSGVVTVAGITWSVNFPVTPGALQETIGGTDAFVTRFDPTGRRVLHSTLFGGAGGKAFGNEMGIVPYEDGSVVIAGATFAIDFPTTPGAYMTEGEGILSFVSKLTLLPEGTARHGSPSASPASRPLIGPASGPFVGQADFGLTCTDAPQLASGLLALSALPLEAPVGVVGVQAWVELGAAVLVGARSSDTGFALVPLPIPDVAALAGLSAAAQFFWRTEAAGGWVASDALLVTVQP